MLSLTNINLFSTSKYILQLIEQVEITAVIAISSTLCKIKPSPKLITTELQVTLSDKPFNPLCNSYSTIKINNYLIQVIQDLSTILIIMVVVQTLTELDS